MKNNQFLKKLIIDTARQHGMDSEPDHETGDLQDVVTHLFDSVLTEDQVTTLLTSDNPIKAWIVERDEKGLEDINEVIV